MTCTSKNTDVFRYNPPKGPSDRTRAKRLRRLLKSSVAAGDLTKKQAHALARIVEVGLPLHIESRLGESLGVKTTAELRFELRYSIRHPKS